MSEDRALSRPVWGCVRTLRSTVLGTTVGDVCVQSCVVPLWAPLASFATILELLWHYFGTAGTQVCQMSESERMAND